jgi:hypothetical protein
MRSRVSGHAPFVARTDCRWRVRIAGGCEGCRRRVLICPDSTDEEAPPVQLLHVFVPTVDHRHCLCSVTVPVTPYTPDLAH